MRTFHYTAFGLNVQSAIECPELLPSGELPADGNNLVRIRYGDVPTTLEDPRAQGVLYQVKPDQFLLRLDHIARYLVSDGKEITIDRVPDSRDDEVRLFLLGSAFGALLHQRGFLTLHGSAIETKEGVVIFTGPSGVGKSTLAAAFQARGYSIVADDVCAISLDKDGVPQVFPSYPQLKLWADAVKTLERSPESLRKVRPQLEKYALPLQDSFARNPMPFHSVYVIGTTNTQDLALQPLQGTERFQAIANNTYRLRFLEGLA